MFLHTKNRSKLTNIKFGRLGMAGLMLFTGLSIASVVGNLPGVTPKAHAYNYTFLYTVTTNVSVYGCQVSRNTIYGPVWDVHLLITKPANYTNTIFVSTIRYPDANSLRTYTNGQVLGTTVVNDWWGGTASSQTIVLSQMAWDAGSVTKAGDPILGFIRGIPGC